MVVLRICQRDETEIGDLPVLHTENVASATPDSEFFGVLASRTSTTRTLLEMWQWTLLLDGNLQRET